MGSRDRRGGDRLKGEKGYQKKEGRQEEEKGKRTQGVGREH